MTTTPVLGGSALGGLALLLLAPSVAAQSVSFGEVHGSLPGPRNVSERGAAADVDGDGDKDVVVLSNGTSDDPLHLYLGDGEGRFVDATDLQLPAIDVPSTSFADALELADMTGDGAPEVLAIAEPLVPDVAAGIVLLVNDGAGSFTVADPPPPFPTPIYLATDLATGDIDADGDRDILVAARLQPSFVVRNEGGGSFTLQLTSVLPLLSVPLQDYCELVDVDGDGDLDAIFGDINNSISDDSPNIQVYLNDGLGLFTATWTTGESPPGGSWFKSQVVDDLELVDLDTDGQIDVVGPRESDWSFTPPHVYDPRAYAWENVGGGSFSPHLLDAAEVESVAVGDLDLDGVAEIVAVSEEGEGLFVLTRVGAWDYEASASPLTGELELVLEANRVALDDLDTDGDLDLMVLNGGPFFPFSPPTGLQGADWVRWNDGTGGFTSAAEWFLPDPATGPISAFGEQILLDCDGDGDLDLVSSNGSRATLYRNDGSGVFGRGPEVSFQGSGGPDAYATGDLDGDGSADLVVAACSSSTCTVNSLLGDGTGVFTPHGVVTLPVALFSHPTRLVLDDADGDGDLDLFATPGPTVLKNVGGGAFAAQPGAVSSPGDSPGFALADLDGDGHTDLVTSAGAALTLLTGAGDLTFADPQPIGTVSHDVVTVVLLEDFDGDGEVDVLAVARGSGTGAVHLYLGDGAGSFADASGTLPTEIHASATLRAADLDGDTDVDLFGIDRIADGDPETPPAYYLNDGLGGFSYHPLPGNRWVDESALSLGDVDGDRDVDAVIAAENALPVVQRNLSRQLAWQHPPRVGRVLSFALQTEPNAPWLLLRAAGSTELELPPFGTLWLDPFTLEILASGVTNASGRDLVSGVVPNQPALLGVSWFWQALLGGSEPSFSNLEITTLQPF